ncbi:MAG: fumarate hydratase [Pseudomonadales bacterium]|jgi:fumarate hydratase class I|nr:fumarate hydratase [Pseudomonadales bacterium]MDP6470434.1 fumarate hydratase [Pseudomonadales bacterium]MDP6827734.1 fumarate hydratase [Pseudomonadales bacterium]MDP6973378.1 fumarate hydratase [Pseudomonadales bacterium]
MTVIKQDDLIQSIADALQFISYYHPVDFIRAMREAYECEESPAARAALQQVLVNSRMCALGKRPICQDTGIVIAFVEIGMDVRWDADMSVEQMINEGVRRGYANPDNVLRGSVLEDPDGARANTGDNSPAVIYTRVVPGDELNIEVAAKGGGSEAKAKFAMLNPSDSVVDWILDVVPTMGAGWCPPGMLGVGIGGTPEKAMLLAKESLMEPIDMHELQERGPANRAEELRVELFEKVNALGIGAQGLGGLTTVLDVKVREYATHAANKPVAVIPSCSATRHVHFSLDGSGPAEFEAPDLSEWPDIDFELGEDVRRVDLETLTRSEMHTWKAGDTLLLSGRILTGRDAAHKKIVDLIEQGVDLPVDFADRIIYYVGPVDPVRDEAVGPAGPTTATRMDKFTRTMLERTGLMGMIGKAERGPAAVDAIRDNQAVSLIAVGGAAYLVSKAITKSTLLAFPELGMEAIYEFEIEDMPVTVAVDSTGESVHREGPKRWSAKIAERIEATSI